MSLLLVTESHKGNIIPGFTARMKSLLLFTPVISAAVLLRYFVSFVCSQGTVTGKHYNSTFSFCVNKNATSWQSPVAACEWERERITFKLCLLVYKAMNGPAPSYIYTRTMCASHNRRNVLCSPLCSPWWPPCSTHQAPTPQPDILRRWSDCVEQFASGHPNCTDTIYIQEPA